MSLFTTMQAECPACGAANEIEIVASVAGDRRPDLRDDIIAGTFQTIACPACGASYRPPPRFTYMDSDRQQWFVAHPAEDVGRWAHFEAEARRLFDATYGAGASPAAQALGRGVRPRVVFGWPAVREKLLCDIHGLDDVTLELLKTATMASVPGAPIADDTELRLDAVADETITLGWFVGETAARLATVAVPRTIYRQVEGDAAWGSLRNEFRNAAFVDLARLLT